MTRHDGGRLVRRLPRAAQPREPRPLSDYAAPQWWLDFSGGFVRRGLPGEVLRRAVGGVPTYPQVTRAGVLLSRSAAVAVVPLAARLARRAPGPLPGVLAGGLVLASPLSVPLLLQDTGRYDAVGVSALALLAGITDAADALPPAAGAALAAGTVAVATACEEALVVVLAPAALTCAARLATGLPPRRALLLAAGVLAPGAGLAAASALAPVPTAAVAAARRQARAAGVAPPDAMGDALGAVERSLGENLAFFRLFAPTAVAGSVALWAGTYGATAHLLDRLLGRPAGGAAAAAVHAGVGAALSVLGADFRRWWGLALLGLVTVSGAGPVGPGSVGPVSMGPVSMGPVSMVRVPPGPRHLAAAVALGAAGLALRRLPVHPGGPVRPAAVPATPA